MKLGLVENPSTGIFILKVSLVGRGEAETQT